MKTQKLGRMGALAILLSCLCTAPAAGGLREAKLYYFYFSALTVRPIDSKDIENCFDVSSLVRKTVPDIEKVLAKEDLPSSGVKEGLIRLKLVRTNGKVVLMDRLGNVSGLGKPHRLSVDTMKELRKLIYSTFPDDTHVE